MPVQKTQAFVIRTQSLGEVDKIISFYTSNFGKMRAVARGIKRSKSRLGGSLELLNYGDLVFFERPNKDLQIINSFDILDSFGVLKDDLTKTAYAFYIAELLDVTGVEGKTNEAAFQLTLTALSTMEKVLHPELLVHAYELQLLTLMGYQPQLYNCVGCTGQITGKVFHFSPPLGGMLCDKCFYRNSSALHLSRGTCELMKRIQMLDLPLVTRISASDAVMGELKNALSTFITFQLERHFKSLDFIASIKEPKGKRARGKEGKRENEKARKRENGKAGK